jgi:hypothetical protein
MIDQEPLPSGTVRDQRLTERVGQWWHGSGGKRDTSAERLQRLGAILGSGDWQALQEWRRSQLAMLFVGKTFPEPEQIDLSKIIR